MNYSSISIRGKKADPSLVIPIYRSKTTGELFISKTHNHPDAERITCFKDQAEMLRAMDIRNPDTGRDMYSSDPQFRAAIEGLLESTDASALGVNLEKGSYHNPIPDDAEMLRGLAEDAARQRYQELVDRAGGNDAVAKFELAKIMLNPTPEQHAELSLIQELQENKPYETYLKQRNAAGLGPERINIPLTSEEEGQAYEDRKNQEALDFLASVESEVTE